MKPYLKRSLRGVRQVVATMPVIPIVLPQAEAGP